MKYKYGNFTSNQLHEYKELLHKKIHWLLIYQETNYPNLLDYFSALQSHIAGLNELFDSVQFINLATTIECAKLEYLKTNFNHKEYRKLVLDAHAIVDSLPEMDGDENE